MRGGPAGAGVAWGDACSGVGAFDGTFDGTSMAPSMAPSGAPGPNRHPSPRHGTRSAEPVVVLCVRRRVAAAECARATPARAPAARAATVRGAHLHGRRRLVRERRGVLQPLRQVELEQRAEEDCRGEQHPRHGDGAAREQRDERRDRRRDHEYGGQLREAGADELARDAAVAGRPGRRDAGGRGVGEQQHGGLRRPRPRGGRASSAAGPRRRPGPARDGRRPLPRACAGPPGPRRCRRDAAHQDDRAEPGVERSRPRRGVAPSRARAERPCRHSR